MFRDRKYQFGLRGIFFLTSIAALFLWWWFSAYETKEQWGNYSTIQMQSTLRRNWNGTSTYVDDARLVELESGKTIALAKVTGTEVGSIGDWWVGDRIYEYWKADGTKLIWEDWLEYVGKFRKRGQV